MPREILARLTDDPEQKKDFPDFCHRYDPNPLIFAPGAGQSYCNTDYHLLALITEQVSGMGYGDYVRENIFEKCGLEHTTAVIAGNETSVPRVFGDLLEAGIDTPWPQGGRGGPEESTPALRTCGPSTGRSFQAFWSAKSRWRK